MIVGDIKTITNRETASSNFIVSSATVSITKPDGNIVTPNVNIDNNNSVLFHDLTTNVTFDIAGQYFVNWTVVIGTQSLYRRHIYFASYFDIHSSVREYLQTTETDLSDSKIDNAIVFANKLLISRFPDCLTNYQSISETDRYNYDMALSFFVASILWDYSPNTTTSGELIEVQIENDRYKYANNKINSALSNRTLTEIFIDRAFEFLGFITCIAGELNDLASGSKLFNKSGPRRKAREFLSQTTDALYELIYDARLDRQWESDDGN